MVLESSILTGITRFPRPHSLPVSPPSSSSLLRGLRLQEAVEWRLFLMNNSEIFHSPPHFSQWDILSFSSPPQFLGLMVSPSQPTSFVHFASLPPLVSEERNTASPSLGPNLDLSISLWDYFDYFYFSVVLGSKEQQADSHIEI